MNSKSSIISMSRNYIIVPRDVPPENFKSVPETIKVKRTPVKCFVRSFLFVLLVLCLAAATFSGVYLAFEESRSNQDSEKTIKKDYTIDEEISDNHQQSYKAVFTENNETVYVKHKETATLLEPCLSSPCQGGGSCESHDGTFSCYCPPGRWGQVCQRRTEAGVRFNPSSYVKINFIFSNTSSSVLNIKFKLQPTASSGSLLQSGHLSLELEDGLLTLHHNTTRYPYYQPVGLGDWSQVTMSLYHGDVMIQLDHRPPLTVRLEAEGSVMEDILCIGHCQENNSFTGCLMDLRLGHRQVSLLSQFGQHLIDRKDVDQCNDLKAIN